MAHGMMNHRDDRDNTAEEMHGPGMLSYGDNDRGIDVAAAVKHMKMALECLGYSVEHKKSESEEYGE